MLEYEKSSPRMTFSSITCSKRRSRDENSGREYPLDTSLTFVSLTKLTEGNGTASELASFLLGDGKKIRCNKVKRIANAFIRCLKAFCMDKGVRTRMSLMEKYKDEGIAEGIALGIEQGREEGKELGIALGANRVAELVNAGYTIDEALKIATGQTN